VTDLQSHREIGCDFSISAFVDHVRGLVLYQAGISLEKGQMFFVATKDVGSALNTMKKSSFVGVPSPMLSE
jgi:hypothetical protein